MSSSYSSDTSGLAKTNESLKNIIPFTGSSSDRNLCYTLQENNMLLMINHITVPLDWFEWDKSRQDEFLINWYNVPLGLPHEVIKHITYNVFDSKRQDSDYLIGVTIFQPPIFFMKYVAAASGGDIDGFRFRASTSLARRYELARNNLFSLRFPLPADYLEPSHVVDTYIISMENSQS